MSHKHLPRSNGGGVDLWSISCKYKGPISWPVFPLRKRGRCAAREQSAKQKVAALEKQLQQASKPAGAAAQRDKNLAQLEMQLALARQAAVNSYRDIRNASPAYRLMVQQGFKPADLDRLQRWVHDQEGILFQYLLGQEGGYLLVVPADGAARFARLELTSEQAKLLGVEPGPLTAERMRQALLVNSGELNERVADKSAASQLVERLAALWQVLVPEAERAALLAPGVRHLIVVPDAVLATLPFEMLVVEASKDPKYLLDVGPPIVYGPSATLLLNLSERVTSAEIGAGRQPVLTVGDAKYRAAKPAASALAGSRARSASGSLRGSLQPLPHSKTESNWVAAVFSEAGQPAKGLLSQDATEAKLRALVSQRRILHLACHGLTERTFGNFFGALALTPGKDNDAADDGFLTLPEIYELNLQGCELTILSACQSNCGPQQRGEGVWALSRGFLVAGSRRVVASNWLVDDEAAANLVTVYCRGLVTKDKLGTTDYAAALHKAKKWARQQPKWNSPYYWAPFVLIGPM